ncbi:MAG: polymer-forming cytoskeletal protein [Alphaproteobacteria bacterium]|nr:polymer-forming cytoskeletal protein [Alphaproteobacteria bacterium]
MKNLKRLIYVKLARKLSHNNAGAPVPTIVSENTRINGDMISDGIVHVDGQIEGDITCDELIIGTKGMVSGSIKVANLQLFGTLKGKAEVNDLFIAKTAKLLGDATHNSIAIEPGAYIDGRCTRKTTITSIEQPKVSDVVVPIIVSSSSAPKNKALKSKAK